MSKGIIFLLLGFLMLIIELFFWEYENQKLTLDATDDLDAV